MIIKIEDAPKIRHIKIDINFNDLEDSNGVVSIKNTENNMPSQSTNILSSKDEEINLNLNENFDISSEIVEKPVIPTVKREENVAEDMKNLEL